MSSFVFSPTPPELALVSQIFSQADPQKTGVLTGDIAVRVFGGAKLSPTTLGTIWSISDEDDKGWLPKKGVAIAVRLIGWAQKGEKITKDLVKKRNPASPYMSHQLFALYFLLAGPLAVIEGINTISQQDTGMSLPGSPPPTPFPALTTQDKARFHSMFMKHNPENSLLSGSCFFSLHTLLILPWIRRKGPWYLRQIQTFKRATYEDLVRNVKLVLTFNLTWI